MGTYVVTEVVFNGSLSVLARSLAASQKACDGEMECTASEAADFLPSHARFCRSHIIDGRGRILNSMSTTQELRLYCVIWPRMQDMAEDRRSGCFEDLTGAIKEYSYRYREACLQILDKRRHN